MSLRKKQSEFVLMVAKLINFAADQGYSLTFGDAYRDPRSHGAQGEKRSYGRRTSAHKQRLAIDFNLFKDGKYLRLTSDHEPLGVYWESLGGTWGGRWRGQGGTPSYDGNHYSLEFYGIK